jgi:ubiquitin carboxyl-terminal hydrolase L5
LNQGEAVQRGEITLGSELESFKEFASQLPPEYRGEVLSNSERIRDVHNSFARASPFVDETARDPGAESEDVFHFIAYTSVDGVLYELDGLMPAPISHGKCTAEEFPERVVPVLERRIGRYPETEIRFNLLAMVRDGRLRAQEIGDVEGLMREEQKRTEWQFENALRRHNFVGFAAEVLKMVVQQKLKDGGEHGYRKWVDVAVAKTWKRAEEREGRKERAGGDVEMEG